MAAATLVLFAAPAFALADTITISAPASSVAVGNNLTFTAAVLDGSGNPITYDGSSDCSEGIAGGSVNYFITTSGNFLSITPTGLANGYATGLAIGADSVQAHFYAQNCSGDPLDDIYSNVVDISVVAPPATTIAIAPTSTGGIFLADAGATVSDPGVLEIVGIAVGVPLAFYILSQLIALVPRKKTKHE